jgi:signal transduction histidine kinase
MKLHDFDAVTNKAIVFGALAAFITGVYVAIVVGVGEAIGTSAKPNLGLSILATALVAVAYRPARARIQRVANGIVYGPRATPYEVLARFSDRVAGTYASEDVLTGMARILAEGTGATRASVWLRLGGELRPAASWPAGDTPAPGSDRTVPVRHHGEILGALSAGRPSGEAFTPAEEKLLEDLASQAGQVLRNVRLTEELRARLDEISIKAAELRASRQRIVAAQDEERRRLERNIHDGAQQHLVALAVKLRLARNLVSKDAARSRALLIELQGEAAEALETLRGLARGIYPPLLAEGGLLAALTAQSRKVGVHTSIDADGIGRYPSEVEAAIYFCCLEALQNVAKYASALAASVKLHESAGALQFSVTDDGVGFDPEAVRPGVGLQNMRDRVEALGGRLEVTSSAGRGTSVSGWVPLQAAGSVMPDQAAVALDQASASRSGPNTDFGM